MLETIVILDCDQALSGLIARTLRSQDFYCELAPPETTAEDLRAMTPKGVIIAAENGGTVCGLDPSLLQSGVPVLALGAAAVMLCELLGGKAEVLKDTADNVTLGLKGSPLFEGITGGERVLHNLRDLILPDGARIIATATERCIGFSLEDRLYAIQYTIERNDPDSLHILHNFASRVCGMEPIWDANYIIHEAVEEIRRKAGEGRVLCAVSGGIDSAVSAKLAHMAVGDRLTCLFVDTGLFRKDEPREVAAAYQEMPGVNLRFTDAHALFLKALEGVRADAEKERIVSSLLKQVFYEQLEAFPDVKTVVMGTNYNDTLYGLPMPVTPPIHSEEGVYDDRADPRAVQVGSQTPRRAAVHAQVHHGPAAIPRGGARVAHHGRGHGAEAFDPARRQRLFRRGNCPRRAGKSACGSTTRRLPTTPTGRHGYVAILRACQAGDGEAYAARLPYDLTERVTERILTELPLIRRVVYDLTPSYHYSFFGVMHPKRKRHASLYQNAGDRQRLHLHQRL